jgi:hypothetical protein
LKRIEDPMLDIIYISVASLFFLGCWLLTKACDKL